MAVRYPDHSAKLWNLVTGEQVAVLGTAHPNGVLPDALEKSHDEAVMIWEGSDGSIAIRDVRTGAVIAAPSALRVIVAGGGNVYGSYPSIVFSPDDERIAIRAIDHSLVLLDGRTGSVVGSPIAGDGGAELRFSTDGKRVVSRTGEGSGAILDAASGRVLYSLGEEGPDQILFDREGLHALLMGEDWSLIDIATNAVLAQSTGADWEIDGALVADGRYAVVSEHDNRRIVDMQTGRVLFNGGVLAATTGYVRDFGIQFSADNALAVTRAPSGKAQLWNVPRGRRLAELGMFEIAGAFNISPEEEGIVDYFGPPGTTGEFRFSADGEQLVTRDREGRLSVWSARTGALLSELTHIGDDDGWWVSDDASLLVTIPRRGRAAAWDLRAQRRIATFSHLDPRGAFVEASPDDRVLVIGSPDTETEVWNLAARRRLPLTGQLDPNTIEFSDDGAVLAATPANTNQSGLGLYDTRDGRLITRLPDNQWGAFKRVGETLLFIALDGAGVSVLNSADGATLLRCDGANRFNLDSLVMTQGGLTLVLERNEGEAELWRIVPTR